MRYTAAHLDDGHAALGRFQLLHAVMVLRGIATVPAQRLRMKKASVPHNTCASRAARAATYPFQGNGRVYVVSEAAALRQFLCFLPVLRAHPLVLLLTCTGIYGTGGGIF